MDQFVITGGVPLRGVIRPAGNKNATLPLLAACLLTDQPVVLHNVPAIGDVLTMRNLLEALGVSIESVDEHSWRMHAKNIANHTPDAALCRLIRASILLAGPMLARHGQLQLPPPGGDIIGRRRLDTHMLALQSLGAEFHANENFEMRADRLRGTDILLDETSVTATENTVMAAVLATGATTLRNAASEPHVQELCHFLNARGARIAGIGSNVLTIEGVNSLQGGEHTIGPDYLEVVSFIGAAAVTGGEIRIERAGAKHLHMAEIAFKRLGVGWQVEGDDILVPAEQSLRVIPDLGDAIPKVDDAPWPGFPADLMSIAIVVATQCAGTVLFHEKLFESRLYFVDKLAGMGGRIIVCDPHRCIVQGPSTLQSETLESPDIRAGMALLIAALCARGESVIRNIGQIERGYERIEEKFSALGAQIERSKG
ncbi:MAG: UDP-N-acetylglucosamine 1-carboxyvinyltransferase [Anaerolineales bacterium]|jgi:UDP-N-acetylglucosamine 1-carboxyvinyltransferase|nr:UDP-N-acetylglucosamine 1-carboxyvinyltransferase [Anaerolineales bacterium]|tara:strand:+ start:3863 stop:5143 length:1281 start_codon:yes stop_codon:yes gene_type:complete